MKTVVHNLNLPLPQARRWRWSRNQDTWRCWHPSAPSCGSPYRSVRGKTPCIFGTKTFWCSDWENQQAMERLELHCSADRKQKKKHSQRGDVLSVYRSLYVNTTVRFSQLPPPVAKHHQAVLKWGRTCHFSGSLTQKLLQPEQDCSHHYCKDSSFMTL